MKRNIGYVFAIALLAFMALILSRMPLANSKSRPTVGERHVYTAGHNHDPNIKEDFIFYVRGDGPHVALIPSAGRPASDFNELVVALNSAGYKTFAFNHAIAPEWNSIVATPVDLDNTIPPNIWDPFLENIETQDSSIVIIGHAFGNRVARSAATIRPDLVEAVVLLAAEDHNKIDPIANEALKNAFNPLMSTKRRKKDISYAFFAEGNEVPPHWLRGWNAKIATTQGKIKHELYPQMNWRGAGGVPMLVVQPANDVIAPKEDTADVLLARYPNQVEVVVIENAGHALLPEQPEAVAEAVIEYLDRMSGE